MSMHFLSQFANQVFSVGQMLAFEFNNKKMLQLGVKDIEGKFVVFV